MKKLAAIAFAASAALFSTGCELLPNKGEQTPPPAKQCNAQSLQGFVGQKLTLDTTERIRAQTNLIRIIRPGQPVTMDYNGARVNIYANENDIITMITCG